MVRVWLNHKCKRSIDMKVVFSGKSQVYQITSNNIEHYKVKGTTYMLYNYQKLPKFHPASDCE